MFSFEESYLAYHKQLNPKLFVDGKLKPDVKEILLKNAYAWIEFANIPSVAIKDIILTGGNAQYNYTRFSDLDVHIVIDKSKMLMGVSSDFLEDYLSDKKTLWTLMHHNKVCGYNVELYAQDVNDNLIASGVYSLINDNWIKEPIRGNYNFAHDAALKNKVDSFIDTINRMIVMKYPVSEFDIMKRKIKNMRKAALASGDEFAFENLIFKSLRNSGVLEKMNKYIQHIQDQSLSLK